MATFLNLVGLHQLHHVFFLSLKKTRLPLKLNNNVKLGGSAAQILFPIFEFTYYVTLMPIEADLASMPKAIARKIKLESITMGAQGLKQEEIAESLRISTCTIQRAKAKQQNFGDIEGGARKRGRKSILSEGMEDVSINVIDELTPRPLFKW